MHSSILQKVQIITSSNIKKVQIKKLTASVIFQMPYPYYPLNEAISSQKITHKQSQCFQVQNL